MKKCIIIAIGFLFSVFVYSQEYKNIEGIGELSEGLIALKKDTKWGFINPNNKIIVDYRGDIVASNYSKEIKNKTPLFKNNRCLVVEYKEGIPHYGYIDNSGKKVIENQFLNASDFTNGYAIAIVANKSVRGENQYLKKKIISYTFLEIIIDDKGNIIRSLRELPHILMSKKRYEKPYSNTRFISNKQVAIQKENKNWEIILFN